MQMLHNNRKPWTKTEKKLALSIYYKSPSTYKYMRKQGVVLPGESTVRRWLKSIEYTPGFINDYLNEIKTKVSAMLFTDRKCVILLDEMSILKYIEYNKALDMIEGFEDLGPLGRSSNYAKHALVIMVRGLYKNWKFPLCYFLSGNGVSGNELVNLIKQSVKQILDIGLLPTSIVCDQGSQNRKLFSLLGGTELNPLCTIHALKNLYTSEYSDLKSISSQVVNKKFFLLTNRLNQDPLENMFSIMRQKNGYTKNPSARMFRSCFANICSFSLMKASDECNCELDEDEFLSVGILDDVEVSNTIQNCTEDVCTSVVVRHQQVHFRRSPMKKMSAMKNQH
ncbi:uncharacterized protein LOC112592447 [Melanaphis sacchari]|uniref:uncharacterized protein LOC112592447 n=1 Tax=Melanaphis sacchari TaxID=742174 RepID=UPI000DC14967|nr:uncharacterized protein LOC112592447 [Melanaphis sacchari]